MFIDESGDPGFPGSNPTYILVVSHMSDAVFDAVRKHVASFRYFHEVTREFKDWGGLLHGPVSPQWRSLLGLFAELTATSEITTTGHWLVKEKYVTNGGPYLGVGETSKFRNFQLRLLLERHKGRRAWGPDIDVVMDRWSMSLDQRRNLEDYVRNNWRLRPVGNVTTVSSSYVDSVQIVDLYTRLVRRVVEGKASLEEEDWCTRLMDLAEVERGLY